jgi:hypothetical protein
VSHQLRTVATLDDLARVAQQIRDSGGEILHWRWPTPSPELIADYRTYAAESAFAYAVPRELLSPGLGRLVPAQGYWVPASGAAPLVEFSRGEQVGPDLYRGRLWYESRLWDGAAEVAAPSSSLDWAADLFRWVRRTFSYHRSSAEYLGPLALEMLGEAGPPPLSPLGRRVP